MMNKEESKERRVVGIYRIYNLTNPEMRFFAKHFNLRTLCGSINTPLVVKVETTF